FTPLLKEQDFYGFRYEGERLDCGSKAGYIKANLRVALDREDIVDEVSEFIADFHKMTTQKNKVS
ncbi:MAG: hypothetical protein NWR43_03730, partial [Alphaproteobacteria bacterium]|nr:hypothetical protein [Alphaproteobacteria bacterium]